MTKNKKMVINPVKSTNLTVDKTMLDNIFNKLTKDILEQNELEYLKQIALKKQIELISYLQKEKGIRFKKIKILENNDFFQKLLNGINLLRIDNPSIKVDCFFDALNISTKFKKELTFHNVIRISLSCGSYIKISSTVGDSLEISEIRVNENKRRNGEGSRLMNIVFDLCYSQLEFRPRFILECTGSLESNGISTSIGIQVQTCFFRKFGFRVEYDKHYPNYVMMSSPKIVTDKEEQFLQMVA